MSRVCIECISNSALQATRWDGPSSQDSPMLEYTKNSLLHHLDMSGPHANELYYAYKSFFLGDSKVRNNWWTTLRLTGRNNLPEWPVVHIAIDLGVESWVRRIFDQEPEQNGADPNSKDTSGTVREQAVKGGYDAVVQLLDEALLKRRR
jgi:hypothetical protein